MHSGPNRGMEEGGLFLAMDTSGAEGSVALARWPGHDDASRDEVLVLAESLLGPDQEHAALLVPTIQDLLSEFGVAPGELAGIVVGAGPGSFTGVRVGAATAKGMAWALACPLFAFSSLAGAAAAIEDRSVRPRLVLFDARGDRLYAGGYRISHGSLETLLPPTPTTVRQVLDDLVPPGAILAGDGALRHRDLLEGAGHGILDPPAGRPSARGLARLLSLDTDARPVESVNRWEPDYLRDSGAERIWKTRQGWKDR